MVEERLAAFTDTKGVLGMLQGFLESRPSRRLDMAEASFYRGRVLEFRCRLEGRLSVVGARWKTWVVGKRNYGWTRRKLQETTTG